MYIKPTTLSTSTTEYYNLTKCVKIFEELTQDMTFKIQSVYSSLSNNTRWTTIIAFRNDGESFQVFTADEWSDAVTAESDAQLRNLCNDVISNTPSVWTLK